MRVALPVAGSSLVCIVFGACLFIGVTARAHFDVKLRLVVVHVNHDVGALEVLARVPLPYLVADKLGAVGPDGLPGAAPFTASSFGADRILHSVDWEALRREPLGLGAIFEDALLLRDGQNRLRGTVIDVVVRNVDRVPEFETLAQALAAVSTDESSMEALHRGAEKEPLFAGDAVVDLRLRYDLRSELRTYSLATALKAPISDQERAATVLIDHNAGASEFYSRNGLLHEPVSVKPGPSTAFLDLVAQGIKHVIDGLDHVLFVLCLTIGAPRFGALVWRVSGFTLGHSVTLIAGFLGIVPTAAWFISSVEIAIAASIVCAALFAFLPSRDPSADDLRMALIAGGIGLVHGLGFSFVLRRVLSLEPAALWEGLLALNVGIEVGQLAVVLVALSFLQLIRVFGAQAEACTRVFVALVSGALGAYWVVERGASVFG